MIGEASCPKASEGSLQSSRDPTQLAPGFRFHPTDEELVSYYLKRKITGRPIRVDAISEVDLYRTEPWDLPPLSLLRSRDLEWYFFTSLDRKYANRNRTSRATAEGYWKTTGKDRPVHARSRTVGMKKTLVYHAGRAPRGQRTNWVMHEYRLEDEDVSRFAIQQDGYVLCKIFQKIGAGPQNGAQYGAPFIEEEWEMEEDEDDNPVPDKEARVDSLVDPAVRGFVQLGDFLLDQDSGNQQLGSYPDPIVSDDEDCSLYIDDPSDVLAKCSKKDFDCIMPPDVDFPPLQDSKTPLKELGRKKAPKYQPSSPSAQNYEFVQLKDIFGEECASSILNMETAESFLDRSINDSIVDEDPALLNINGIPSQCFPSHLADANLMYHDAVDHDFAPYVKNGMTDEMPFSPAAQLDFLDELIAYYDATEDDLSYPVPDSFEPQLESRACQKAVGSSSLSKQDCVGEKFETSASNDGSLSRWNGSLKSDTELMDCPEKTLTKRLASILDAISAPPAFADEASVISKLVAKTSASPSDTVHIAAGMIQIQSLTLMDSTENWGLHKLPDMSILLSYERRKKANGGFISVVCWAGFHLLLLSAFSLVLGYKLGVCAYNL